jgi:hypothetical protein
VTAKTKTEEGEKMRTGTQQDILKQSQRAYIMQLGKGRFQVYVDDGTGLDNLWPLETGKNSKELLPLQIYSAAEAYPAYHFYLRGTSRRTAAYQIADVLREINPALKVFVLDGGVPDPVNN